MLLWEVLGWVGSAVVVASLLQTRVLRLRAWNLLGCLILAAYNASVAVWPMVGLNGVLVAVNAVQLRRLIVTRHDAAAYQVVEVDVRDRLLAHLLTVHRDDIARFNPGFTWPVGASDRLVFLVLREDEMVGVVLVRALPDAVAQVELDYVTPRYRDFTPGEFVFGRGGPFAGRGFRTVLTPPAMVAPYYDRVGFRKSGDCYVLDVGGR